MAIAIFPTAGKKFGDGDIDFLADTISVILVKSAYTYDATDEFVSDIGAGNEISVSGYARGTLASKTGNRSGTVTTYDAADQAFAAMAAGQTIGGIIIAKNSGADATSALIAYYDGGSSPNDLPKATTGGAFTVVWPSTGLFTITTS